jgi:hypothetical protein
MMTRQRSKFWAFIFSLMPGCGQMFLGFMRRGLSLAIYFWGAIFLLARANIFFYLGELTAIITWFYAFFDTLNLNAAPPEIFAEVKDGFVNPFSEGYIAVENNRMAKLLGAVLTFAGVVHLWDSVFLRVFSEISEQLYNIAYRAGAVMASLVVAVAVIAIGVRMIMGKKKEIERETGGEAVLADEN